MASGVSRAVIEVLLDRMNQGAGTLSPEGTLVYSNERLAALLGKTRAQLVGKPFHEIVAERDREALASALSAGRDGATQCQLALPRPNGSDVLHAMLTFQPLGHGQMSCVVTDLAQGKVLRALAHETRNMLGALRGGLEILKRSALDADGQRALDAIERQSVKVLELMEELRRLNPKE